MQRNLYRVGGFVTTVLALFVFGYLRQRGLLAPTPYWALLGFLLISFVGDEFGRSLQRARPESIACDRIRLALTSATTALVLYSTGWGSVFAVGFAVGATQVLAQSHQTRWRWAAGCNVVMIAAGELAIEAGLAPTVISKPLGHAVAGAGLLGLVIVLCYFGEALVAADANRRLVVEREERLIVQATTDSLTKLPNRVLLNDRLEQALSRLGRAGGTVAVLVVDLDGFKNVNDSLGHRTGDELLIAVAKRFQSQLRTVDTLARLGGDEFAVVLEGLDAAERAGIIAQRLVASLAECVDLAGRNVPIGASVGITLTDRADADPDQLLGQADVAMYRAKHAGKGCYRHFELAMHTDLVERIELERALETAIVDHALCVYYQPIVDSRTQRVTSFEALARWPHPTRGFVPPDIFIPVAEQAGLINHLGQMVLDDALQQLATWRTEFPQIPLKVAVNASSLQLERSSFSDDVLAALWSAGVEPSDLIIEVTESAVSSHADRVIGTLNRLRSVGVSVAIDDFGTGYSSLAALADLPVDILKIDKRFVDRVSLDEEGRGFVTAIMTLATTLGLETVAEGVETADQRQTLAALGCTQIQGYLHSRPLPADDIKAYLQQDLVNQGRP